MVLIGLGPDPVQLLVYNDETYPEATNTVDPNTQYFAGSSAAEFLTGNMDTDMNFDWVSTHLSIERIGADLNRGYGIANSRQHQWRWKILVH
jgi:hypothetical protein